MLRSITIANAATLLINRCSCLDIKSSPLAWRSVGFTFSEEAGTPPSLPADGSRPAAT